MLSKSGSNPVQQANEPIGTSIRIDVDPMTDVALDAWAKRECRSKRQHVEYLVGQVLAAYTKNPLAMHQLALIREGAARVIPA